MSHKHYFIAFGLAGSTVLLYALTNIWPTPTWIVAITVMTGAYFAALAFLNPVDPAHRHQKPGAVPTDPPPKSPPEVASAPVHHSRIPQRKATTPPDKPGGHSFGERLAYSLWGLLTIGGVALFLGIPISVAAGYQYAATNDVGWVDVEQYRYTFGLLFTVPMFVMVGLVFAKNVEIKVAGVVSIVVWSILYWIGHSFHDDLGVVTDVGRSVAQWWVG